MRQGGWRSRLGRGSSGIADISGPTWTCTSNIASTGLSIPIWVVEAHKCSLAWSRFPGLSPLQDALHTPPMWLHQQGNFNRLELLVILYHFWAYFSKLHNHTTQSFSFFYHLETFCFLPKPPIWTVRTLGRHLPHLSMTS